MSNRIPFNYDLWIDNQQGYKVVTRDGGTVPVLHNNSEREIVYGIVEEPTGDWYVAYWGINGKWREDGIDSEIDLFLIPVLREMSEMGG